MPWVARATDDRHGWSVDRSKRPALVAGASALLGWGALVIWDATGARFHEVVSGVGAVLKVGGAGFVEIALLLPFLIAFAAAGAANALRTEA